MLSAAAITRRFGRTLALSHVDFEARPGEIHALLGENGAGKTTLMNIFTGRLKPDSGTVALDGRPLRVGSPLFALQAGIAAVHQSPLLFERFAWEENLALGGFDHGSRHLDLKEVAERARALAASLGFELPPASTPLEHRSVAERVRLEVLRALSFNPRVLILDEPTGILAPGELAAFLGMLARLRAEGRIVVLITHKLAEALEVADRITVLRQGRVVMRTTPGQTSEAELARTMVGELVEPAITAARGAGDNADGEEVLVLDEVSFEERRVRLLDRVSLRLRRGEIVGVAGVDGNGQTELMRILAGVSRPTSGRIEAAGRPLDRRHGALAVIPQNRDLDGLILDMPLWENLLLAPALRSRLSPHGWLDRRGAIALCARTLERFKVRALGPGAKAAALSGGNRQRLEVARAIAATPRIIAAHNITRGLDLAATAEVHRVLLAFAREGGAVLLISSDLDELLAICGRVAVLSRGRLRETAPEERNPETLGLLMAGAWGRAS